jgi:hypothetical protein
MPDDDYEVVTTMPCGCEHCAKINDKMDKAKEIEKLLAKADHANKFSNNATHAIIQVLRLMNGIE